jgi:L-threonylcarbamoyladenylate synthase
MMSDFNAEIKTTLDVLKKKGIILYPTDTIWGIGCDATCAEAVSRVSQLKKRGSEKSFILLLDEGGRLPSYIKEVPETAWPLIEYSTRPLTIIYDGAKNLPEEVIAEDGSVGIRITNDEFCKRLIGGLRKPLLSTSANISGKPWPASFDEIDPEIINGVDYVVNWRQNEKAEVQPSTIMRLKTGGEIKFIRR